MNWFTDFLFGKTKQEDNARSAESDREHRARREQQQIRRTLDYARQHRDDLLTRKAAKVRWQSQYGNASVSHLRGLSGIEFENYLGNLFRSLDFAVEQTPASGDYGADLIIRKNDDVIAVQAKCYSGSVGVSAVQEVLAGMAYYQCKSAWVITTGYYTQNAMELARKSGVRLLGEHELSQLINQSRQ